jgi:hypothetical protein
VIGSVFMVDGGFSVQIAWNPSVRVRNATPKND